MVLSVFFVCVSMSHSSARHVHAALILFNRALTLRAGLSIQNDVCHVVIVRCKTGPPLAHVITRYLCDTHTHIHT